MKRLMLIVVVTMFLGGCQHMGSFADGFAQGYSGGGFRPSQSSRPVNCVTTNPGYGYSSYSTCY